MNEQDGRSVVSDAETDATSRNENNQGLRNLPEESNALIQVHQHLQHPQVYPGAPVGYPVMPPAHPSLFPPSPHHPNPPGGQHILQFYEAQMRDHAAAYASAAAGAAWAAAQIAADMAHASMTTGGLPNPSIPRTLPVPPHLFPSLGSYPGPPQPPPPPHPYIDHTMAAMPGYPGMEGYHHEPPIMEGYYAGGVDEGSFNASENYGHRRRKRQQRMPPSDSGSRPILPRPPPYQPSSQTQQQQHQPPPPPPAEQQQSGSGEKRGRRRRFRNDGSSGNEQQPQGPNSSSNATNYNTGNAAVGKRRAKVRKNVASPNHSSDGGNTTSYFNKKKKARQPNDESLLGKTGVSALYEWCGKRRTTPNFVLQPCDASGSKEASNNAPDGDSDSRPSRIDDFEMAVTIDGIERGRGRASSKAAAKQEAARRALLTLLPGVVFDEASGILVQLPSGSKTSAGSAAAQLPTSNADQEAPWKASASLEDLAPNLAKRLAIGHADDEDETDADYDRANQSNKKRPQKWHSVYPCTSTTSEEEDENAYYESRGASVCSALLHAMVQIDDRIPEAPSYSFEMVTMAAKTEREAAEEGEYEDDIPSQLEHKAKIGNSSTTLAIAGRCAVVDHRGPFTCTATMRLKRVTKEGEQQPTKAYDLLKAVGIAGSKREARHTASAKLLAMLFPECNGMVQVKEAAEAARDQYAASKALKLQSKRERTFTSRSVNWNQSNENSPNMEFAMGKPTDPKLPSSIQEHLTKGLGVASTAPLPIPQDASSVDTARQLSRQKQLENRISRALQKLNDHDDEGRSLPDEPTVDDVVGRTVLRRATPDDLHWISMLLEKEKSPLSPISVIGPLPISQEEEEPGSFVAAASSMWAPFTVVLLLCRAIAPYEDPPLGCAVMTLGFSMVKGQSLSVAQIGSKPHLPRERFIECLQSFAKYMQCFLDAKAIETASQLSSSIQIRDQEINNILKSHLPTIGPEHLSAKLPLFLRTSPPKSRYPKAHEESLMPGSASPLQSVKEESEGVEESGAESGPEKRVSKKEQDKPSKRSRVQ